VFADELLEALDLLERHLILVVAEIHVGAGEDAGRRSRRGLGAARGMRRVPGDAQPCETEREDGE
jgi:hypothetical protein